MHIHYLTNLTRERRARGRWLLPFALVVSLWAWGIARADSDAEEAYGAVKRGEIRSLLELIEKLGPTLGGDIIGVELEFEDGRYVYEFEIVTPLGRLQEVYVDATTGRILKREDD